MQLCRLTAGEVADAADKPSTKRPLSACGSARGAAARLCPGGAAAVGPETIERRESLWVIARSNPGPPIRAVIQSRPTGISATST